MELYINNIFLSWFSRIYLYVLNQYSIDFSLRLYSREAQRYNVFRLTIIPELSVFNLLLFLYNASAVKCVSKIARTSENMSCTEINNNQLILIYFELFQTRTVLSNV